MAYRFSVGCCCDKEIKTCEELIEAGGPFPNITWGDATTVMEEGKLQTGSDNQYGFLWLCSTESWIYEQDFQGVSTSPFATQQYRTYFSDGVAELRENGNLLASYSYGQGPDGYTLFADEDIARFEAIGRTMYATWVKCSDKRQTYYIDASQVQNKRYAVTVTGVRYEITLDSVSTDQNNRYPVPRQNGETETQWVNRAVAGHSSVWVGYGVRLYGHIDLEVTPCDFSQFVPNATIYKRWIKIVVLNQDFQYNTWSVLGDDGSWHDRIRQWFLVDENGLCVTEWSARFSTLWHKVHLYNSEGHNYETYKTISEEQAESDLITEVAKVNENPRPPMVSEFVMYND